MSCNFSHLKEKKKVNFSWTLRREQLNVHPLFAIKAQRLPGGLRVNLLERERWSVLTGVHVLALCWTDTPSPTQVILNGVFRTIGGNLQRTKSRLIRPVASDVYFFNILGITPFHPVVIADLKSTCSTLSTLATYFVWMAQIKHIQMPQCV